MVTMSQLPKPADEASRTTPTSGLDDTSRRLDHLALIVVTYRRQELLKVLFDSIEQLTVAPWRIIVVDNESSPETQDMVENFRTRVRKHWGLTIPDGQGGAERVVYAPQSENLGGAGGFHAGVKLAYQLGAKWFWVMDDDVAVLPDALERLAPWAVSHEVIQGARYDRPDLAQRVTG